ncbi:hypothetical protein KJA16_03010 [Patescibacteria group bacterium]|nr:hypothetical protein [Patescibacteria group bacterium]
MAINKTQKHAPYRNEVSGAGSKLKTQKFIKGISIIEILIVIAIIAIALTSLLGVVAFSLKASISIKETTKANTLAQETIEAVRNFRDGTTWDTDGLGTLTTDIAYYPKKSDDTPPKWTLIQATETINGFTRKIVFEKVSRDPTTDDIEDTYNSDHDDPNTREAIATVFWKDKKVEIVTYFTNWRQ